MFTHTHTRTPAHPHAHTHAHTHTRTHAHKHRQIKKTTQSRSHEVNPHPAARIKSPPPHRESLRTGFNGGGNLRDDQVLTGKEI